MGDPRGNHSTYRNRLRSHIVEFNTTLEEFKVWESILKEQTTLYEADFKGLSKYRDLLDKLFNKIQDDYNNSIATLQKAIDDEELLVKNAQGEDVPADYASQEKTLRDKFERLRTAKLNASDKIARHLLTWEQQKATL